MVPEQWHGIPVRTLLEANPFGQIIIMARQLLYDLALPSLAQVGYMSAWVAGLLAMSVWVFRRWGQDVAEAV
jgi:ABC-type polysaccharide/polyol phosphate export permease